VNAVEYQQSPTLVRRAAPRAAGLPADVFEPPLSQLGDRPGRDAVDVHPHSSAADDLRILLAGAHSLCAMLGESSAPGLPTLRETTERACTLAQAGKYDDLTAVLGKLLPGLEAAVRTVPPPLRADAYELTAKAYQACSAALMKLAEPLAAWVAADRAMAAAEKAGNVVLAAAGQFRLASVLMDSRECALADEMARTALLALRGRAELADPDALSLCGGLTVLRAVIAARCGHSPAAFGHLAKARLLASRLGTRLATAVPEFGSPYVAVAELEVSVELGDADWALRVAASIDPACLPPTRNARMHMDVARAFALRKQLGAATSALARAADLGFGEERDRQIARDVVRDLLAMQTPAIPSLAALAKRLQVLPA
jgi:hypothetical protein